MASFGWGSYSALSVDPVDNCTFWFVSQYMPVGVTNNWRTRIASFKYDSCNGQSSATCPCTLFPDGATPPTPAVPDSNSYEVGVRFHSDTTGFVTAIKFYKGPGNGGVHIGRLWSDSGNQLAGVQFTNETATGWQTGVLSQPVQLQALQSYTVSYGAPMGRVSHQADLFDVPLSRAPLFVQPNGARFALGAGNFPNNVKTDGGHFFVDLVFVTTQPQPAACPCSVFGAFELPTVQAVADSGSYEVGMRFRSAQAGVITAVRFFKGPGNGGTHVGRLWTVQGSLLGTVIFTSETATGWQQANFLTPLPIQANTPYVVSYGAPVGRVSADNGFFNVPRDSAPLHAFSAPNGFFGIGAGSFPANAAPGNTNYWVDVVFSTTAAPPGDCPCTMLPSTTQPPVLFTLDANSYEVGMKIRSDEPGFIGGVRFYKGTAAMGNVQTVRLWTAGGTLLAISTTATGATAGWYQSLFTSSVPIEANVTYIVSYGATSGRFPVSPNLFTSSSLDNGPVHAPSAPAIGGNGVFALGAGNFPSFAAPANAYFWTDLLFTRIPLTPLTNDNQANAISVTVPFHIQQNTANATHDGPDPTCGISAQSRNVWFRFTPLVSGIYGFTTDFSDYNTVLAVYTGNPGSLTEIACDNNGGNTAPTPGGTATTSKLNVQLTASTQYFISVSHANSTLQNSGTFVLRGQLGGWGGERR
jgi:hypothetical protein